MLADEYWMPTIRRLLAIIGNKRRRQTLADEIAGMFEYRRHALVAQILQILVVQVKLAAKPGFS